jgi:hypothetical protein
MMASRLQPLPVVDFTGGLNLGRDPFQLAENESPDLLNVELDARGGLRSREGWIRWSSTNVTSSAWTPKNLVRFYSSSGTRYVVAASGSSLFWSTAGTSWTEMKLGFTFGATSVFPTSAVHGASFVEWNDRLYVIAGRTAGVNGWFTGAGAAIILLQSGPTWQNDYTAPTNNYMPSAEFGAAHAGYMFVANTSENGTVYKNRLRWSHPNSPDNWHEDDRIDILEGGDEITGLVSFNDHLLIFKRTSIWALYGNDAETWQLVNVTRQLGVSRQTLIARSEDSVWFFDWPNGLFRYGMDGSITDVFSRLRPAIQDGSISATAVQAGKAFLNFVNRRVWLSLPYSRSSVASAVTRTFVFDPLVGEGGAWLSHQSADGFGVGPAIDFLSSTDQRLTLALHPSQPVVLQVEKENQAADAITADVQPFPSYFKTGWLSAGVASQRKMWRRPDFIAKRQVLPQTLSVQVFKDFDERSPSRAFQVQLGTTSGGVWGSPGVWTDSVEWGVAGDSNEIDRGSTLGTAKAVQLRLSGLAGVPWSVNGVVFKFIPRRLR